MTTTAPSAMPPTTHRSRGGAPLPRGASVTTGLGSLHRAVGRQLATPATQRAYARLRPAHRALTPYGSVLDLVAVFKNPATGRDTQDRLLRLLVGRVQAPGAAQQAEPWRLLLLYAFLPGMIKLHRRTRPHPTFTTDDTASLLWTSLFEVVHAYPLCRPGFIAAGILRDLAKAYHRALDLARADDERLRALKDELPTSATTKDPEAAAETRRVHVGDGGMGPLDALRTLPPEDAALVRLTVVGGMTVRAYMDSRGMVDGDPVIDQRTVLRLRKRRHRALLKLRGLCGMPESAAAL